MTASQEQITDLMNGVTDLKAFFEAERTELENARANLDATVSWRMRFTATVDPANADPNPGDGDTFATIADAVHAAPCGAHVTITLIAGQSYDITEAISVRNRFVLFVKSGAAADPVIVPQPYVVGDKNYVRYFLMEGGELAFRECVIDLTAPKADPALDWQVSRACLVSYALGASARVGMYEGELRVADGRGLITASGGRVVQANMYRTTVTGGGYVVTDLSQGVAAIAAHEVTLAGGAALADGGVRGVRGEGLLYN